MGKKVTIIIPSRNEEKFIKKCLDSFVDQSYPAELYEVFVCDGMSTDNTRDIVNEYNKNYSNIKLLDNKGLTAPKGMNVGIKASNADIIIIFGAHATAHRDFIKNNVIALENSEVGCAGGPINTISENELGNAIALAMSSPFGVGNALFRYGKQEQYVDTVAFGAYRRDVLEKVGYFDEELVRNQDDEMNFRVIENGYKVLLSPKIQSDYYSRSSLKKLWKQYFQYGFWKVRVMQKHGKTASIRHLIPLLFVITNILGCIGGIFFKPILYLWLTEVVLYCSLDIVFSAKLCKKNISMIRYLLVIFPILHLSYGIGFIEGLINFYILKSKNAIKKNAKMSR